MADRDKYVYMAKLAEQAEKYDEMARSMKHIVLLKTELSVEERNLLSVAYKNIIGARRASWRTVSTMEQKEEGLGGKRDLRRLTVIQEYRKVIEKEMVDICNDVQQLLDGYLIPSSAQKENQTFFYKMKGDYYRYMAEFTTHNEEIAGKALAAYKDAMDIVLSKDSLAPTHPVRLGLALNFSVFFFEILGEKFKALLLSRDAFEEAVIYMDSLTEENYKDTTLLMQLLRDNIAVWTSELEEEQQMLAQAMVNVGGKLHPDEDIEANSATD